MSHFSVLVMSYSPDDIMEQLAPYAESPSEEYLEFVPTDLTKEDLKKTFAKVKNEYGYKSFDEFMRNYYGYIWDKEASAYGRICNPNTKWDWYEIGGRWSGHLKLKPEAVASYPSMLVQSKGLANRIDQALLKDVDFTPDEKAYQEALRFWEVVVEGNPLEAGEKQSDFINLWKPQYYTTLYASKEEYAQTESAFSVWAIVTLDGEWHEVGTMGWFGMSNETREDRQTFAAFSDKTLAEADPNIYLTVVDCHIISKPQDMICYPNLDSIQTSK